MDKSKFKALDPHRPNTLPRYLPQLDASAGLEEKFTPEGRQQSDQQRRKLAQELFSRTTGSIPTGSGKVAVDTMRRSGDKELFTLDTGSYFDTFALPGKPEGSAIMKSDPSMARAKRNKKVKTVEVTTEYEAEATHEFAFLATAIGASPRKVVEESGVTGLAKTTKTGGGGQSSDLDQISTIMADIKTGDDAINFFARYGSDTPVKFVDFIQANDPKEFKPYDLVAINLHDPHIEHFTISSSGIVHVCPGEPSECVSLSNWMRQGMMFRILRNIPFYRYFLHRKMFNAWKENVRFQLYQKQRKRVADRLFLTRKTSCNSILSIKRYLMDIQTVKLLQLEQKISEKDNFVEQQTAQFVRATAQFEESMRHVITEVQQVIAEVSNQHGLALQDPAANALNYSDSASPEKAKSLVKMKQEKAERKLMRQRAKLEFTTLPEFIRFVDYLSVETLVGLAIGTANAFYEEFVRPRKTGVFETMVKFNSQGTIFSPTCQEIRDVLSSLMETMINTVGNVNRVSYLTSKGSSVPGANIQSIIRENKTYRQTFENIDQRVKADFLRAEEHAQSYDSVRPIYDFNAEWDFDAYRAENHDIISLKMMMEKINNWNKELEKLRNRPIGVLEVDSKHLKAELNPMREARLQEIKEYIKDVARNKCLTLRDRYKDCLNKLAVKPQHLKDFAAQVQLITQYREEEKNLFKATSQVDQMYNLLQSYEVAIQPEDAVLHEELYERQQEYRVEIEAAQTYRDNKIQEMTAAVESNILKLQDQVASISSRFDEQLFVGTEYFDDAGRVLDELNQLGSRLDSVDQTAKTYAGYQKLFGANSFDQGDLEVCKERYESMRLLWDTVKSWNEKHSFWLESQFTLLPVEDINKEVQMFYKNSYAINKKLGNKVSEQLSNKIADFRTIMPNVCDLGNPNMQVRHYDKLFRLVGLSYYQDMPFSLSLLLKANIMNHKDAIQEISGSATGEHQLEEMLAKIRLGWEKMKFIILNHRDQHGLFILGSLEDIFTLLEDNQVNLQTMLGSRFIRGIQDRVEEWEKKLATLSETLDEWVTCQRTWMYLENIFGAEDIQKQLPAESQKFLVVDRSWKAIMTRTNADPLVLNALLPLENGSSLLDAFLMNNVALESIQKSLEEYLETKRMAFPRFYFLSNDELLEILSQTRDPHAVQPHMSKCFDAIKRIKFGEGRNVKEILGFLDPAEEYVPLETSVRAEGAVETWLLAFEHGMRNTLYELCKEAFTQYPPTEEGSINRKDWLWKYPAQVVIAIDQVVWTANCGGALARIGGYDDVAPDPEATEKFLQYSLRQVFFNLSL